MVEVTQTFLQWHETLSYFDVIYISSTKYISVIKCSPIQNGFRLSGVIVLYIKKAVLVGTYSRLAKDMNPI